MKRHLFSLFLLLGAAMLLLSPAGSALADTTPTGQPGADAVNLLGQTGLGGTGSGTEAGSNLPIIVGRLIRAVLGLLGIIFVVLMVYAGFLWMTARGESEKVEKAKDTITRAVIGIIIIFLAYAITGFVVNAVITATK